MSNPFNDWKAKPFDDMSKEEQDFTLMEVRIACEQLEARHPNPDFRIALGRALAKRAEQSKPRKHSIDNMFTETTE
jgi:hypothetical protein